MKTKLSLLTLAIAFTAPAVNAATVFYNDTMSITENASNILRAVAQPSLESLVFKAF